MPATPFHVTFGEGTPAPHDRARNPRLSTKGSCSTIHRLRLKLHERPSFFFFLVARTRPAGLLDARRECCWHSPTSDE